MAQFDESKVINALHVDKAEVGKRYWYANNIISLMREVTREDMSFDAELQKVGKDAFLPFIVNGCPWQYIYPYEESPKKRMTNRQLFEWLAKGNGEYTEDTYVSVFNSYPYTKEEENNEVVSGIKIRTWDSEEWVEPTVNIYEKDCRKVRSDNFCSTSSIE